MLNCYQIKAPHFTAGFTMEAGVVLNSAPIVWYMSTWNIDRIKRYCYQKGWELTEI